MPSTIGRRGFMQSVSATGSFLACYGVVDRSRAAMPVRITPPVVDRLTIQAVVDTNHDIFISGASAPGVGVERVRSPAARAKRFASRCATRRCRPYWSASPKFLTSMQRLTPQERSPSINRPHTSS